MERAPISGELALADFCVEGGVVAVSGELEFDRASLRSLTTLSLSQHDSEGSMGIVETLNPNSDTARPVMMVS